MTAARVRGALPATALVLVAALVNSHFALRSHTRFNDELNTVYGGRFIAGEFPSGLLDSLAYGGRGPERLTAWLYGLVDGLTAQTATTFDVVHVALAFAMALTAVPLYLLARGVGLGRWQALLPGALVVLGPWAIFATTLLNTTLGLLTFTVQLAILWRVATKPSRRWELAVLVAVAATILARVGHAPFVFALAPALLAVTWWDRPPGEAPARWLRRLPGRLVRRWPLLTAVAALGVLAVLTVGQARLLGGYGAQIVDQDLRPGRLWDQARTFSARTALTSGFLPLAIALPWLVREAVRPRSRESGAFAVLGLGLLAMTLYVFYTARVEDRYIAILLPVIAVAFAVALFRRELSVLATGVVGAVLARAIATSTQFPGDAPEAPFEAPGAQFFRRVVVSKVDQVLPGDARTIVLVAVAAGTVLLVLALRRLRPARARGLVVATALAVVAYTTVTGLYAQQKFTQGFGRAALSAEAVSWVDAAADGDTVGLLIPFERPDVGDQIQRSFDLSHFNASLRSSVRVAGQTPFECCSPTPLPRVDLEIDRETGAVRLLEGELPPLIATPAGVAPYGLATRRVATGDPAFALERPREGPPGLSFVALGGTTSDGWGIAVGAVTRRVFPDAARAARACWTATLEAAALLPGDRQTFTITGGAEPVRGSLAARELQAVSVPLRPGAPAVLRIRADVGQLDDLRMVTVRAAEDHVVPCGEPAT